MIFAPSPLKKGEKDIKNNNKKPTPRKLHYEKIIHTDITLFQECENRLKRQWFSNFPSKHRKKDLRKRKRTHCVVKLDKLQIWEFENTTIMEE